MFFVNITDRICLEIICGVAGEQKEEVENIPTLLAAATGEDTVYIYYTGRNKEEKKKNNFGRDRISGQMRLLNRQVLETSHQSRDVLEVVGPLTSGRGRSKRYDSHYKTGFKFEIIKCVNIGR